MTEVSSTNLHSASQCCGLSLRSLSQPRMSGHHQNLRFNHPLLHKFRPCWSRNHRDSNQTLILRWGRRRNCKRSWKKITMPSNHPTGKPRWAMAFCVHSMCHAHMQAQLCRIILTHVRPGFAQLSFQQLLSVAFSGEDKVEDSRQYTTAYIGIMDAISHPTSGEGYVHCLTSVTNSFMTMAQVLAKHELVRLSAPSQS